MNPQDSVSGEPPSHRRLGDTQSDQPSRIDVRDSARDKVISHRILGDS